MKRECNAEETIAAADQLVLNCIINLGGKGAYTWACAVTCTCSKLIFCHLLPKLVCCYWLRTAQGLPWRLYRVLSRLSMPCVGAPWSINAPEYSPFAFNGGYMCEEPVRVWESAGFWKELFCFRKVQKVSILCFECCIYQHHRRPSAPESNTGQSEFGECSSMRALCIRYCFWWIVFFPDNIAASISSSLINEPCL